MSYYDTHTAGGRIDTAGQLAASEYATKAPPPKAIEMLREAVSALEKVESETLELAGRLCGHQPEQADARSVGIGGITSEPPHFSELTRMAERVNASARAISSEMQRIRNHL